MLKRVEGDHADRVVKLARHKIGDDSFEVCPFDFRFSVNAAQSTEAVDHKVDGLIRAIGHDRWRPTGLTHGRTPRNRTGNSIKSATIYSGRHWRVLKAGYCGSVGG